MLKRPVHRGPVGTGLSAGNDGDWGSWSDGEVECGVLRFFHGRPLEGLFDRQLL